MQHRASEDCDDTPKIRGDETPKFGPAKSPSVFNMGRGLIFERTPDLDASMKELDAAMAELEKVQGREPDSVEQQDEDTAEPEAPEEQDDVEVSSGDGPNYGITSSCEILILDFGSNFDLKFRAIII